MRRIAAILPLYENVGREILFGLGSYLPREGPCAVKVLNLTNRVYDALSILEVDGIIAQADRPERVSMLCGLGLPVVDVSQIGMTPGFCWPGSPGKRKSERV